MLLSGADLYALDDTGTVTVIDVSNDLAPAITERYPLVSRATRLRAHRGTLYLAGESTLTAVKPLPDFHVAAGELRYALRITPDTPLGTYSLAARDGKGKLSLHPNSLRVSLPRFSKPKFTLEDLQRVMQERELNDGRDHAASQE